jgi:TonB family protein
MAFATKYDQIKRELEAEKEDEKKIQRKSLLDTFIALAIFIGVLVLLKMPAVYPPLPEAQGGMEMIQGVDLEGTGGMQNVASGSPKEQQAQSIPQPPVPTPEVPVQENDPDAILKKEPVQKTPPQHTVTPIKTQTTEPEHKVNTESLFKKSTKTGNNGPGGESLYKGNGSKKGNQGDPNGNPNGGWDPGHGTGKGPGNGPGYNLHGFGMVSLPQPEYHSQVEGKVIVRITVDQNGNVIEARGGIKGSTITDPNIIASAERAAKIAKFKPQGEVQERNIGTITYNYKLQ